MGLFNRRKTKNTPDVSSREDRLKANEGVAYTTEIIDNKKNGEVLTYKYEKVKCKIIGDTNGLLEGAILYARRDGVLVNVIKEDVAQIESEKIRSMVNDTLDDNSWLSSIRVKYLSEDGEYLFCNMGFWTDPEWKSTNVDEEIED